ncbi:hypothetical protein FIBSPDRAFT_863825 [Athelia psychrophila]|uniref:Uncharacterized protein n=1 Tax=Athelia psychrophila TaxID=1759441 RepID=A0A166H0H9_9AGAM|nr:hypothetical protein FIBSPDRAFT_863825 [Fibularhizoctonia sp. CBS 109695]
MPDDSKARERSTRGRSRSHSRSRSPHRSDHRRRERSHERDGRDHKSIGKDKDKGKDRSRSRSPRAHRSRRHSHSRSRSPRRRSRSPRRKDPAEEPKKDRDRERRKRSRSRSVSSSGSESDDHKRHKRKKDKHRKRSRSRERREKKEKKKEKKKKKSAAATAQWGKYGIITDADFYTKAQEFRTWLLEERKLNPESISKDQEKKEFSRYVEDYNTATLPDEKYYAMEAYERRMAALRAGDTLPPTSDAYDASLDMRAHQSRHKKAPVELESYLSREQLLALQKVQRERIEAGKMKLLGMDVKTNMGVRMDGTSFD